MPRISQLPSLTAADNADELAIVDVSASTTKKITRGDLLKSPLPTNSVTTAAIADNAVTTAKINNNAITTAKVANGAITADKLDFDTLNFGNYSTTEKDTGFKWIDGKTIYRRTFTGTITAAAASTTNTVIATITGLTNVIRQDGYFYIGVGSIYQVIPSADSNNRWGSVSRNGLDVRLTTQTGDARSNAPYAVTIWYTK